MTCTESIADHHRPCDWLETDQESPPSARSGARSPTTSPRPRVDLQPRCHSAKTIGKHFAYHRPIMRSPKHLDIVPLAITMSMYAARRKFADSHWRERLVCTAIGSKCGREISTHFTVAVATAEIYLTAIRIFAKQDNQLPMRRTAPPDSLKSCAGARNDTPSPRSHTN